MSDRVQSVERALQLLEEVAASRVGLTAPEIARRAGVNRGTAWRLLSTLEHFDLIERDSRSGRYTASYGLVRLARATDATALSRRSRPTLEQLAAETGGSAFLEVSSGGKPVILDEARPASPVLVDLAGMDIPLHCGSVGKLYLATLPEDELEDYLAGPLAAPTQHTITDPNELRSHIAECGRSGVGVNYMEHREEWCGISSAITDLAGRHLAYLNLTLPTYRWSEPDMRSLIPTMRSAASQAADRLHTAAASTR